MDPDPHLLLLLDVERMLQLLRESVCLAVGHPAKHRGVRRGKPRLSFGPVNKKRNFDPGFKRRIQGLGSNFQVVQMLPALFFLLHQV
jgi:hypothetical protein